MRISDLVIEVTRRCNMNCDHCLRGDTQNVNINTEGIHDLLLQVEDIGTITFSGGEPSLGCEAIRLTLEYVKLFGITVDSFYVVTNGKVNSMEFVTLMLDWWLYCDTNEVSAVKLSRDQFHDEVDIDTLYLSGLSFFGEQGDGHMPQDRILGQGRGSFWSCRRPYKESYIIEDGYIGDGTVYLNAKGDLIAGCDWSYIDQEEHVVCSVNTPDILGAFLKKYPQED